MACTRPDRQYHRKMSAFWWKDTWTCSPLPGGHHARGGQQWYGSTTDQVRLIKRYTKNLDHPA